MRKVEIWMKRNGGFKKQKRINIMRFICEILKK